MAASLPMQLLAGFVFLILLGVGWVVYMGISRDPERGDVEPGALPPRRLLGGVAFVAILIVATVVSEAIVSD